MKTASSLNPSLVPRLALTGTAFSGPRRIAHGDLREVAAKVKAYLEDNSKAQILIFDDRTSEPVEIDFRGSLAAVLKRIAENPAVEQEPHPTVRHPGRPKLGVVAREVTLLPRHWEWLATQPGGASVALRKLVEEARQSGASRDRLRSAQESAYRFLSAMAGNEPGFEEALRALFAGKQMRFEKIIKPWPKDIRNHAKKLAAAVFANAESAPKA